MSFFLIQDFFRIPFDFFQKNLIFSEMYVQIARLHFKHSAVIISSVHLIGVGRVVMHCASHRCEIESSAENFILDFFRATNHLRVSGPVHMVR